MPRTLPRSDVSSTSSVKYECTWKDGGLDAVWMTLAGDLDRAGAHSLREALQVAGLRARLVVLDLRGLEFIDGYAANAIAAASSRARETGRRLIVLPGPSHVERVFQLSGAAREIESVQLDSRFPAARASVEFARRDDAGETERVRLPAGLGAWWRS